MGFGTFGTDGLRAEGLLQDYSAAHYIRVTIERETMLRFGGTKKVSLVGKEKTRQISWYRHENKCLKKLPTLLLYCSTHQNTIENKKTKN